MATLIKQIYLSTEDYGPRKGMLSGTIKFANSRGEIQVNIDPQKIERIVAVLAEELVDTARETARLMVSDVLDQARVPAIEAQPPSRPSAGPLPKPCGSGLWHLTKEKNHDESVRAHNHVELHHKPISTRDH